MEITSDLRQLFLKTYNSVRSVSFQSRNPGVGGVDVGFKYDDKGERQNELSVRIHIRNSIQYITNSTSFNPDFSSLFIVEAAYSPLLTFARITVSEPARLRVSNPLQPGVSIGLAETGTLGMFCKDGFTGLPCILTCYHVLKGSSGVPIIQPAPGLDGGTLNNTVAIYYKGALDNSIDAAVGKLVGVRKLNPFFFGTKDKIKTVDFAKLGQKVKKSGRTTGNTAGIIDGIGKYFINYPGFGLREIDGFRIVLENINNPGRIELGAEGDSGAVWYAPELAAGIGLNVAGETNPEPRAEYAVACHLPNVFKTLNLLPFI